MKKLEVERSTQASHLERVNSLRDAAVERAVRAEADLKKVTSEVIRQLNTLLPLCSAYYEC